MNTGKLTAPFRYLGLMHLVDLIKFRIQKIRLKDKNDQFKRENPNVLLPPDYLMFESYRLDYFKYYFGGKESAKSLMGDISQYIPLQNVSILDWGCGPARILRHLPDIVDESCILYGTDYNEKTIKWCSENIPKIHFSQNNLNPPLNYPSSNFEVVYGVSIFTHLSEEKHYNWFDELIRITKKDGVILLTTAGAIFKEIMTEKERKEFDEGKLVTRGKVVEGHRVYSAFQPPSFLRVLFRDKFEILEFTPGEKETWGLNQDRWILRRM